MARRTLTLLAAGVCAAALAACSDGGPADPVATQPVPTPTTATPTSATTPPSSPEATAEETAQTEPAEPGASQGDLIQATYDAMVASQPDHPLLRNVMIMDSVQATFATDPATGGLVTVDAPVGGEPMVNPYGAELPPAPTTPAAGLQIGEHWDAAQAASPECAELMAEVSVLHNGVPAARFKCGLDAPTSSYVMIGSEGFAVHDDYFTDDGVAQAMAMAEAAGVTDVSAIVWQQADGPHLTVPGPSVPLTDGQACVWSFIPTLGGSTCSAADVTHSFPVGAWAESLPVVLDAALPLVQADGGFHLDPAFGIEVDEVTGEPVARFISADQEIYEFGADGAQVS